MGIFFPRQDNRKFGVCVIGLVFGLGRCLFREAKGVKKQPTQQLVWRFSIGKSAFVFEQLLL